IQAREPLSAADRTAFQKALNRPCREFRLRDHRLSCQLRVGFRESGFTGSAFPPLDFALTEVTSANADRVRTSEAGHLISPLALCGETSQNSLWSEAWFAPRFGLAPTPASTEAGALSQLFNWWWRQCPHLLSFRPSC